MSQNPGYKRPEREQLFQSSGAVLSAQLESKTTMKTLILIALVGCSLGVLMQTVASEEPFETAEDERVDDLNDADDPDDTNEEDDEEDEGLVKTEDAVDDPER